MKVIYLLLVTIFLNIAVARAQDEARVSVDFFHDNLEAYGDWREIGDLGYCWQPRDVDRDWRPYSDGRWLYTDAGWTWDSAEPYSWAVFHYGRWARIDGIGWVWAPGTEWAPAWVSWRSGGSQVGWAPLSPEAAFDRSTGFDARVDAEYDMGPTNYNFVDVRNFAAPNLRTVLIDPRENLTIFSQSTNITKITYVNNTVYDGGPQYEVISRQSAQPIPRLKLERQNGLGGTAGASRPEALESRVVGGSLHVVAIPFDTRPATAPRKVGAKVGAPALDHGWNHAGPAAEVAKVHARIKDDAGTSAGPHGAKGPALAPASTASPVAPETGPKKAATAGDPAIPSRPARPVTAETGNPRVAPPANEETAPGNPSKKGRTNGGEALHPAVATPPAKIQPAKADALPKPERAAAPLTERNIPNLPEQHAPAKKPIPSEKTAPTAAQLPPEKKPVPHEQLAPTEGQLPHEKKPVAHEPVAPAAGQLPPAKAKSKDKPKEENKDASKPAGPPP